MGGKFSRTQKKKLVQYCDFDETYMKKSVT